MTQAVMYLRVSGESQIAGDGFPRQREKIHSYAAQNGISVLKEFKDEGVSGKMELEGRAGLSECLQYVHERGIGLVLCESSDRLARDMIVAEVIIREFQKIGVKVVSASGGVDLTEGDDANPTAKLIRQILAAVAEFDRCVIVLKLRGARDRKRANNGRCEGRLPYGEKDGESVVLDEMKRLAIKYIPKDVA
jgi:DNA invertase Pin-like site-specific DNA recombinase